MIDGPTAEYLPLPFDSVEEEISNVVYGDDCKIEYVFVDGRKAYICFEGLDAIRACRGEYNPYSTSDSGYGFVQIARNSKWLPERYAYEKEHYGDCYGFGGNVDEMLTDYQHYVFRSHDFYTEALAKGIWFQDAEDGSAYSPFRPFTDENIERIVEAGINCQIRKSPLPMERILQLSVLCSQPVYQFALELDGRASVNHQLFVRNSGGEVSWAFRDYFRNSIGTFAGIPSIDELLPLVKTYIREVAERRRQMGKHP